MNAFFAVRLATHSSQVTLGGLVVVVVVVVVVVFECFS